MKLYSIDDFRIDKFCIDQYRLDNYRMDGAGGGGGTIIDHSTPVTVVNQAYDTSGNGGRKLVRLSNGWLVFLLNDTTNSRIRLYVSKDNMNSQPTEIGTFIYSVGTQYFAMCSYENTAYLLHAYNNSGVRVKAISDFTTTGQNLGPGAVDIDSSQSGFSGCSIDCDSSGNLYAAWASKNATYPNSLNIRHAKSTDGGVSWTKMDGTAGIDQLTEFNINGRYFENPSIIVMDNGYPMILVDALSDQWYTQRILWNGSTWGRDPIFTAGTYAQSNPSAVVAPNGTIGCAWQGYGAAHISTYHLFFKPSTDNGATWGTLVDVAVGQNPSLTVDENNTFYVQYDRGGTVYQKKSTDGGATWGAETTIGTGTNASTSTYDKFTQPLSIWKGTSSVLFAGVFEA